MAVDTEVITDWTAELEAQVKYIGDCSSGYIWMFKRDVHKYTRIYRIINHGSILIGMLSGVLGALSLVIGVEDTQGMIVTSTMLAFGTSFCQGYINNSGYESTISDLKRFAAKYSGLVNNIRRQLSLPRHLREKAIDYHRWISQSYDELSETSLNISDTTLDEYRKVASAQGVPFPDESKGTISIHIADSQHVSPHVSPKASPHVSPKASPRVSPKASDPPQLPSKRVFQLETQAESEHKTPKSSINFHTRKPTLIGDIIRPEDKKLLSKGNTLRGQTTLQEALKFTDSHMKYEMSRFDNQ